MNCSGPNGPEYRVVQLHPALRCNLKCRHCYSSSGPRNAEELPASVLMNVLDGLRAEGFNVASLSGGEPLLYKDLFTVMKHARQLGMTVTVTTNGMLLNEQRAEQLAENAQLVAISIDGVPESHNHMRSHPRAFEKMAKNLALLRHARIPFGFIFTLTLYNLDELAWVAQFAREQGARLLQVHPLEEEGRAGNELQGAAPDELEIAHAFIEVARLQNLYTGQLTIQFDAADRNTLAADPARGFAIDPLPNAAELLLAALVAPLVLEHDGALVPFQYGVARDFQIAHAGLPDFAGQISRWKLTGYPRLMQLCSRVYEQHLDPGGFQYPFFNWYSAVLRSSQQEQLVQIA
ncbi:MAG TPA: radical SAM protein [Candidatus Angelobacter sp.]|nr:radical SAM protein [Candidatus Angelobacter sp.]